MKKNSLKMKSLERKKVARHELSLKPTHLKYRKRARPGSAESSIGRMCSKDVLGFSKMPLTFLGNTFDPKSTTLGNLTENFCDRRYSKLEQLGGKRYRYLSAMPPP